MEQLYQEAADYCKLVWRKMCQTKYFNEEIVENATLNYGDFLDTLVPKDQPFAKYIHVQRIVYDMYMNDEILVFRFDLKDPDLTEVESFYSTNTFDDDSSDALTFVNGVRLMDEYDLREQILANEFTGGHWDKKIHWVVQKKKIVNAMYVNKLRLVSNYLEN
jgi:hypothetical protein